MVRCREGHVELVGKVRDRSVCTPELLQNAASSGVRERGERGIEAGPGILNHVVQYITHGLAACKGRLSARCVAGRLHSQIDRPRNGVLRDGVSAVECLNPRPAVVPQRRVMARHEDRRDAIAIQRPELREL